MNFHYAEWNYAECHILYYIMLSVIVLNVVMLSVEVPISYFQVKPLRVGSYTYQQSDRGLIVDSNQGTL
jgi:hypothetical protein